MKRILILGCPGSGKSTAAKRLAKKINIPVVHLDKLFWRDGWMNVSREEFDALLEDEMKKDAWIIDGNYSRTVAWRLQCADTAIFFDYPTYICLWRVIKRVFLKYGVSRSDMGGNCPEKIDLEFLNYVARFRRTQRGKMLELLSAAKDVNVIIIKNIQQFKKFEAEFLI